MRAIGLAVLAVCGLAACGDVTRPAQQPEESGSVSAEFQGELGSSSGSLLAVGGNEALEASANSGETITIGPIYGPGNPTIYRIETPGVYSWHTTSQSSTALLPVHHNWYTSRDGGASWTHTCLRSFEYQLEQTSSCTFRVDQPGSLLIKATASVGSATAETAPLFVPVDIFTVAISGPEYVTAAGTYTWEAMPVGGNGTYTYQWEIEWNDLGYRSTMGTGKTLTLGLIAADGDFTLHVTAYSGADQAQGLLPVCNFIYPNGYGTC